MKAPLHRKCCRLPFPTCQQAAGRVHHNQTQGESAQAQRSWVGELAVLGRLVETWLEFTTESGQADGITSVDVRERVAAVVVRLAVTVGMVDAVCSVGLLLHHGRVRG